MVVVLPALLIVLSAAVAQVPSAPPSGSPPPEPRSTPSAVGWSCTRATLLAGLPCVLDGQSSTAGASSTPADEHQRQARALGVELCRTLASSSASSSSSAQTTPAAPIAAVQRACERRLDEAVAGCTVAGTDDGAGAMLDDHGRFNAGHAVCYAALRSLITASERTLAEANGCCACLDASRASAFEQCVVDVDQDVLPRGVSFVGEQPCRSSCAAVLLRVPSAPPVVPKKKSVR